MTTAVWGEFLPPICELCYREPSDAAEFYLTWDRIWQANVCPDCHLKAKHDGVAVADCRGGCYAEGKSDPRARSGC